MASQHFIKSSHQKKLIVGVLIAFACILLLGFLFLFPQSYQATRKLYLNEIVSSNRSLIVDDDGDYEDWLEIYNNSGFDIDLEGYALSDSKYNFLKWQFPRETVIKARDFLLIWLSGKDSIGKRGGIHANFKISEKGERILLDDPGGNFVDSIRPVPLQRDVSYGRQPDGSRKWVFSQPGEATPEMSNNDALTYIPPALPVILDVSHSGGFYSEAFDVSLSTNVNDATIYYTLDGSEPNPFKDPDATVKYVAPIPVKNWDHEELAVLSLIPPGYSTRQHDFSEDIKKWTGPDGAIFQATPLRARAFRGKVPLGQTLTHTYFVDKEIRQRFRLPVVSLVMDREHFFSDERGIYVRGKIFDDTDAQWRNEKYHPANFFQRGRKIISLKGVQVQHHDGGSVRLHLPDHGFETSFYAQNEIPEVATQITIEGTQHYDGIYYVDDRSRHDALVLDVPYIEEQFESTAKIFLDWERPVHLEFFEADGTLGFSQQLGVRIHGRWSREANQKSLRLYARREYDNRAYISYPLFPGSSTTQYKHVILRQTASGIEDTLAQSIIKKINPKMDVQESRFVVMFLNGEFWGLYALRERYDDWYFALKYGLKREQVSVVRGYAGMLDYGTAGSEEHFQTLARFIRNDDCCETPQQFEYIQRHMDVELYLDYMLIGIYLNYADWVDDHLRYWRYVADTSETDNPYERWRWLPVDFDSAFGRKLAPEINYLKKIGSSEYYFLSRLLKNVEFRYAFINRAADLLNTDLAASLVNRYVDDMVSELPTQVLEEHIARWKSSPTWNGKIVPIHTFLTERPSYMREHLNDFFDLEGIIRLSLATDSRKGVVKVNSIIIDKETAGVENPDSWTGLYFRSIPLMLTALPKPGHTFVRWDGVPQEYTTSPSFRLKATQDTAITAIFK